MGNDFIDRVLKKCEDHQKILHENHSRNPSEKHVISKQDVKFILKNNFDVDLGRSNQEDGF